jgi:flagellin-like hook-associated protein FlgL
MSIAEKIATVTGLNYILTRQQARRSGTLKEPAHGEKSAMVLLKDADLAAKVLSTSSEALKNVGATLNKALSVAKEAMLAPPDQREALADQFNALIKQARNFADNATVKGITLLGSDAKPMVIATNEQGGKITVAGTASGGIDLLGKASWLDRQAIQVSVNELQNALITLSNTQTQFAQAQYTLGVAAELNRTSELTDNRFRAAGATAVIAEAAHNEWEAEAKRTMAEEANREAALRESYGRQMERE